MDTKLSKTNQSVEKTMKLVEIMASHYEAMKLQSIAAEAEIPASTTLRMLNTLLQMGYVNQDPDTLKYSLSLKFAYIGEQVKRQFNITQTAHPFLINLSNAVGECSCLAIEENSEILYLDVFTNHINNILTTTQRIGKRAPMYCTGIGKLLLTNYTKEELTVYVKNTPLLPYTPKTITTLAELNLELEKIRTRGFAFDDEECDQGAKCIAAPIRDYTGNIIAGISVTAPTIRLLPERVSAILPFLLNAAAEISAALGHKV